MAPLESLITDRGWEMLEELPHFLRDDPDIRAVIHCYAKESERMEDALEGVRDELNPLTASTVGLAWWESLLRLPVNPLGGTLSGRRTLAARRMRSLVADPSGLNWVQRVTDRLGGQPWSYEEHVPGDLGTPPAQTLRVTIPSTPGTTLWDSQVAAVREETAAELALDFESAAGFILDQSQLDADTLGV